MKMTDREMLLLVYGALRASFPASLKDLIKQVENHLFPQAETEEKNDSNVLAI